MVLDEAKIWPKLRIGVSSCLVGNRVRHNGEHKRNNWLMNQLAPFVSWVPICPEVEMGLGVPRETLRLEGSARSPHLVTVKSKADYTEKARETFNQILKRDLELDAYIFKKDSPTCGLERVKVYGSSGIPVKNGIGLFAQALKAKYPSIPMIEEGRLSDFMQRENFLIQVFAMGKFSRIPRKVSALQLYHQNHKLQLMAYDPGGYRRLGEIAANSEREEFNGVFVRYQDALVELFTKVLTRKKYVNVFQHMLGYFKKNLETKDRVHLLELLEDYRNDRIPLISISTLFGYLVEKHSISYLLNQSILNPYPRDIVIFD